MSISSPRIFYCGMVNTFEYASAIGESLFIGAASEKMQAVIRAIRSAGGNAWLVTIPVLGIRSNRRYISTMILRKRVGSQIFLQGFANRYIRKIAAFLSFAWFCASKVRSCDRIIIYNHCIEYIFGIFILYLKGNQAIFDIEDATGEDEKGIRGLISHFSFRLVQLLTLDQQLIVSESLAKLLKLQRYCVVYGAVQSDLLSHDITNVQLTWSAKIPLRIHFGGSLIPDTGVNLFCDAVDILRKGLTADAPEIVFVVTGFGSEDIMYALSRRCQGSKVSISFGLSASPLDYRKHLLSCHAGLSLRLPSSPMSRRTFPSKVVEITSSGLLLISTRVSDIPLLFDCNSAILLDDESAETLATAIATVATSPVSASEVAFRGRLRAFELFELTSVGRRVLDFVWKCPPQQ